MKSEKNSRRHGRCVCGSTTVLDKIKEAIRVPIYIYTHVYICTYVIIYVHIYVIAFSETTLTIW